MGLFPVSKPEIKIKKIKIETAEFSFKGQQFDLNKDEFSALRNFFNENANFFQNDELQTQDNNTEVVTIEENSIVPDSSTSFVEVVDTSVQASQTNPNWVEIGKRKSQPRNGFPANTYAYYRGVKYGTYQVKTGTYSRPSFNLGSISNKYSKIGRFVRRFPPNHRITKAESIRMGYLCNSTYTKAVFDILEIEGYFEKSSLTYDRRGDAIYTRTSKMDGLEVDTKHELPVPVLPPTHK